MVANTTGSANVAVGRDAMAGNTTGTPNVAIGYGALYTNTTGKYMTAIGYEALYTHNTTNSGGVSSTAVGYQALRLQITNGNNTAVGANCLPAVTTGEGNIAMGISAGTDITTGTQNVGFGSYACRTVTTGNYNTMVGYDTRASAAGASAQLVFGNQLIGTADNRVHLGSSGGHIYNDFTSNNTWTQTSDKRLKKNINDDDLGLAFIKEVTPVTYNWKRAEEIDPEFQATRVNKGEKDTKTLIHGLLAQDVKEAMDKVGNTTFNGWAETVDGQSISREMFITPLINAVKELSAKVEELETKLNNKE